MDASELIRQIQAALDNMAEDNSVPRNIRRGAASAKEMLQKEGDALDVRIASAIFLLDELANDPNIPLHGRTQIWSVISALEQVNAKIKK
ncbi:MAG: UPF0147 family protein [Candidatus Thermoplasmatota archaeon]